jgi:5-formyltetrahydrofolate cyclo-ligase
MSVGAKAQLRGRIWALLEERGVVRFPGARGRIPNFVGAERAAELLATTEVWRAARALKCNPDLPQRPVRERERLLQCGNVLHATKIIGRPADFKRGQVC